MKIIDWKPYKEIPLKDLPIEDLIMIISARDSEIERLLWDIQSYKHDLIREEARNEKSTLTYPGTNPFYVWWTLSDSIPCVNNEEMFKVQEKPLITN